MNKIKLGFVGVGFMGQLAHLSNYAALSDECEIVAITEARKQMGEDIARRYGVKNVFTDLKEMLRNTEIDAVVASQSYANHINIVPDILDAKKPVLTEKPLCVSVENGEILVNCANKNQTLHMVGYHKRSDPAMEYAKKTIEQWKASGEYGNMKLVRITMPPGDWVGGAPKPYFTDEQYPQIQWEQMPEYFGKTTGDAYNAFVNYYIHQVNAMRFLLGESYKITFADKSGVLMAVESESGICGTLEMASFSTSIDWQESLFIGFEKGYIIIELPAPLASQQAGRVTIMRDNGKDVPVTLQPHMPKLSAMRNQAKNFLAAVRGERSAPCESKEALEDLKIAKEYIQIWKK